MDSAVWIAVIVAIPTVLTSVFVPIIMARMVNEQKTLDRQADWARQDELLRRQTDAASKVAAVASFSRHRIAKKLDVIHHLVNGNLSTAMEAELNALMREIVLRREVKALKEKAGVPTEPLGYAAIELCEARIAELRQLLKDRASAVVAAQKEQEALDGLQPSGSEAEVHSPDQKKGG